MSSNNSTGKLYTAQFLRLCLCNYFFFASFNMIIPELPSYLRSMGGEGYLGLIFAVFTLTAGGARPFSGKWADNLGRVPVMLIGALVSAFCGLLYPFVFGVQSFLFLRFLHGFSTGFTPTGSTAYVADIVPHKKRGEAMGIISLAGSLGMASGPAVGSFFASYAGLDAMFYASATTGFVAFLLLLGLKETLPVKKKFSMQMFKISKREIFEPRCVKPAIVLMLCCVSFGTMLTLVPDISEHLKMDNKGIFFTVFTIASVTVRFSAGRISDRVGRVKVLFVSTLLLALAMFTIGFAGSAFVFLTGAVLFGFAQGINSPTIFAWAIDRSDPAFVGRAMATVYISLEIGIGIGSLLSGTFYRQDPSRIPWIFGTAGTLSIIAAIYLALRKEKRLASLTTE